jgi:hypothetical protein
LTGLFQTPSVRNPNKNTSSFGLLIQCERGHADTIDAGAKHITALTCHYGTRLSRAKVFISYAHPDVELAQKLYYNLQESGHNPWLDSESLLPGKNWKIEIRKAIKESHYFIALLSSQSVTKKGYVQKELKIALDILDEYPTGSVYVIPARLNKCEPTE